MYQLRILIIDLQRSTATTLITNYLTNNLLILKMDKIFYERYYLCLKNDTRPRDEDPVLKNYNCFPYSSVEFALESNGKKMMNTKNVVITIPKWIPQSYDKTYLNYMCSQIFK